MPEIVKAVPHVCLVCKHKEEAYYGRLVFPEELAAVAAGAPRPGCPNHGKGQDHLFPLDPTS